MKLSPLLLGLGFCFLGLHPAARAGSIINNFDVTHDFVASGVAGVTNWDGVYLGYGDIPGGDPGGSGNGMTLAADANGSFAGFLTVQTSGSDWSDGADDGFFVWKLVSGDFDVSVESAPIWNNVGFNFAGLMARAYNPNNLGSPYSATSTNAAENWVALFRFQEFGLNEVREANDGANTELIFPDDNSDTNSARFFRMVRAAETNFTFYWKTNASDGWSQITNNLPVGGILTRADLAGVALQVGIAQAMFSTASPQVYFTDFQLSGPNVSTPPIPTAPSNVAISSPNTSGSVQVSWVGGAGSDGSVVVVRGGPGAVIRPIIVNPINGITYTSSSKYSDTNAWIAGLEQVVYAGSGNQVTVTGLGGSNNLYTVAVYSYIGSGSSRVYNTASPATAVFPGPGVVSSVLFAVNPTNIPVQGVGSATIIAKYTTGDSYDVSSDPTATLTSSDPSVVLIQNGVMNGLATGTVSVVVGYAGIFGTNTVSVHAPAFTDAFGAAHDYLTSGLEGTAWDGLFLNFGDVPGANKGNDNAAGSTSVFNSNLSSNNLLSIEAAGSTWAVAGDDGPFLLKILTGDFQASVHVNAMSTINFNDVGLMARLFDNSGSATQGGGGGAGGSETHVNWVRVQNGLPAMRATVDSGGTTVVNGLSGGDGWLLMQRVYSTNFLFFEKANAGDPWTPVPEATITLPEAANDAPMEVGIVQEMRTASDGTATLDTLMIDGTGLVSPTGVQPPSPASNLRVVLNNDLSMTYSWIAADGSGNPVASILVLKAGGPVTAQPTYGIGIGANPVFGAGQSLGDGNFVVYKSANVPTTTNNTVTVTGLTPGVIYYAAAYSYVGPFGTRVFNNVLPAAGASAVQQDGSLVSITTLPPPTIPAGGIGQLEVIGVFTGNATKNVSSFATLIPGDTNILLTADGALTGLKAGTTTVIAIYGGFTNSVDVTVRPPVFMDTFSTSHDYLLNRTAGTPWDGVYLNHGDIPESTFALSDVLQQGVTSWAEANISSNNCLTVTNQNGGWENDENDGFFLWKYVAGDFQMAVHITQYDVAAYTFAGIGARAFSYGTNGVDAGAPFHLNFDGGGTNGECWVNLTRFDEFGIGTYARLNLDNSVLQSTQPNQDNGDNWLLIIRQNGTNFNFYERSDPAGPWRLTPLKTSYQVPEFAGQPMQVGIQWMTFNRGGAGQDGARFDSFMLDAQTPVLTAEISGKNFLISWPAVPGVTLKSTSTLSPANWQPVPGTPTLNGGIYTLSMPASGATEFFELFH